MNDILHKQDLLIQRLQGFESLMVAFSGGVDSTYLLSVAQEVLGENVVAITSSSAVHPAQEFRDAVELAEILGVRHIIIETQELTLPEFRKNHQNRCYVCKQHLFRLFTEKASELGIQDICHGANLDDLKDIRPGFAAAQEHGIQAPLIDAGLTKSEIRMLSKQRGLSTWNKPAMACLATRIPFGNSIDEGMLRMIESAEQILSDEGLAGVRVRHHGTIARIELQPSDFSRAIDPGVLSRIIPGMKKLGFVYVALDLEGYVQGSMNQRGPDK